MLRLASGVAPRRCCATAASSLSQWGRMVAASPLVAAAVAARPAASFAMILPPSSSYLRLLLVRHTHDRNVPRTTGSGNRPGRPNYTGSVLSGRSGGGNGLFDVEEDKVPTTRGGKVALGASLTFRYLFGGVLLVAMAGASVMMIEWLFFNPEVEVRARTLQLLRQNPQAQRVIGSNMIDITQRTMGSRAMQAFHRYPYVGAHPIEMQMCFSGNTSKRVFILVQYLRNGSEWKPIYLHLDAPHGRILLLDVRSRQ